MIDTVVAYEKETSASIENSKKQSAKGFGRHKMVSSCFVSHWKTCLAEMDFDDRKMNEASKKLDNYKIKLNEFTITAKIAIYNNKLIELKRYESKKDLELSYFILFDQFCTRKKVANFAAVWKLSKLNLKASDLKYHTLKKLDDAYLIVTRNIQSKELYVILFNPLLNVIEKETKLSLTVWCLPTVEVNKDRIALMCSSSKYGTKLQNLVVLDRRDLGELHQKTWTNNLLLMSADESFIYVQSESVHRINVLDWSLTQVEYIDFQCNDNKNAFYLPLDFLRSSIHQFK